MQEEVPRRKNGFTPPYTGAQVSTWVALPVLYVEFVLLATPIMPMVISIPVTILYTIATIGSAYFAAKASLIDPMDQYLAKKLKDGGKSDQAQGGFAAAFENNMEEETEPMKHCWMCETRVAEHSMHCKFCNKCVGNFDHHCMWLNTCVGKANYYYFLMTMNLLTAMLLIHGLVQLGLIVAIFIHPDTEDQAEDWLGLGISEIISGVQIFFLVFDSIALSLIGQLLNFHVELRKEGLTTYKYVIRETQRKREQAEAEQKLQERRTLAIGKAHDEGKSFYAYRLRIGAFLGEQCCQVCDPLQSADEETPQSKELPVRKDRRSSPISFGGNSSDETKEEHVDEAVETANDKSDSSDENRVPGRNAIEVSIVSSNEE